MSISFGSPQYLWLFLLVPLTIALGVVGTHTLPGKARLRLWIGLALRSLLLTSIILALAGIQLRLRSNILTSVFILDASDSISPDEQARGESFILQAIGQMSNNDRAAIVVFGEDALVERLASTQEELNSNVKITSVPIKTRTDIASALQLAMALFPGEGAQRLVLLSDGQENLRQAIEQAELAALQGIELSFVSLSEDQRNELAEVLIDDLQTPNDIRLGEDLELHIAVRSTNTQSAALRVFAENALVWSEQINLQPGTNTFLVPIKADQLGSDPGAFIRLRAQIIPQADNRLQNNEISAFTVVHGPPHILLVEGQAGEDENLARALQTAEMRVNRLAPSEIPTTLPGLVEYDAIILSNVKAGSLPPGVMEILPIYVRDIGKGLLMTGGPDSFGAGGYLRTPLEEAMPVAMDVKDRELQANLALVLAVDKSGSMGRCHCDNPDLNQSYTRAEVGQPKVDIAKEAIMRSASALGEGDYLGVVTFDSQAHWLLPVEKLTDRLSLEQSIGTFTANGQTNLRSGVEAAYQSLQNVSARRKHIILMTDGWVRQGDLTELAQQMNEQGITLSVIAAGEGSAEYLATLAKLGGGRYYPATDILNVPEIFLKETVSSIGRYIIEEPFYPLPASPGPVLRGLDTTRLPALSGYNGTTARNTARLDLITPRGDPLLATWQYGLGRSAAWTSDLKGQWAKDWLAWDDFSRFAAQLVGWILPAPQTEGLQASISLGGQNTDPNGALVKLQAIDQSGRPLNFLNVQATIVDPNLNTSTHSLKQSGAGQYQADIPASQPGTYLVRLGVNNGDQSMGQVTLGMVVPYSPEYKSNGANQGLLEQLARVTGGSKLLEPAAAFIRDNLPSSSSARSIWWYFLLFAALLFPIDVAIRRLVLSGRDIALARAWITQHIPWRSSTTSGATEQRPQVLGRLFDARQRARQRHVDRQSPTQNEPSSERPSPSTPKAPPTPAHKPIQEPGDSKPQAPASVEQPPEDTLQRLRDAKRRARH